MINIEIELCLHMPYECNHTAMIADTIIPWTQEWLLHYEIWLATGEWCGGGQEPKKRNRGTEWVISCFLHGKVKMKKLLII